MVNVLQTILDVLRANGLCNEILGESGLSGGCINDSLKISTDAGPLFVKVSFNVVYSKTVIRHNLALNVIFFNI